MADPALPSNQLPGATEDDLGGRMSFFEHLVDLRKRLINSAIAIAIGAGVGLAVSKRFITFITQPMLDALRSAHLEESLYYTSPAAYVSMVINLGLYIGRSE